MAVAVGVVAVVGAPSAAFVLRRETSPSTQRVPTFGLAWVLLFLVSQWVALALVLGIHPAGLDECEAAASDGERAAMVMIASASVVGCAALALWCLRGWRLAVALSATAFVGFLWLLLLSGQQNC